MCCCRCLCPEVWCLAWCDLHVGIVQGGNKKGKMLLIESAIKTDEIDPMLTSFNNALGQASKVELVSNN